MSQLRTWLGSVACSSPDRRPHLPGGGTRPPADGGGGALLGSADAHVVANLAHVDGVAPASQLPGHLVGVPPIVNEHENLLSNRGPGPIDERETLHEAPPQQSPRPYPLAARDKRT
jgi:hypothetical protein